MSPGLISCRATTCWAGVPHHNLPGWIARRIFKIGFALLLRKYTPQECLKGLKWIKKNYLQYCPLSSTAISSQALHLNMWQHPDFCIEYFSSHLHLLRGLFYHNFFNFKFIFSFSFLYGPWNHVKHLFSKERVPFTLVYLLSLSGEDKLPVHLFITQRCLFGKLLMLHVQHFEIKKSIKLNK